MGAAPRQPPELRIDRRTGAFCFRSNAECERSTSTPCGPRDKMPCQESSAKTCANAGAGFTYYCPTLWTQVDSKSGSTCYRRKTECERTTFNECGIGSKPCIVSASLCGETDSEYKVTCPPGGGGAPPPQLATGAAAGARTSGNASTYGRSTG
jgi:hypothetical protein